MSEKFNQQKYIEDWKKENMLSVSAKFKKDFVLEFKKACTELGLVQSQIFKNAMQETINKWKDGK